MNATETTAQVTERVVGKVLDRTEDFVQAAATTASNVFEAASNILTTAVEKYGQSVVDAVLWVVRIDALQVLVTAWIFVGMAIFVISFITTGFTRRGWSSRIENGGSDGLLYVPVIVAYIIAVVVASLQLSTVSNIWLYTAVAKPELYLAKQAVDIVKERLAPKPAPQQRR
jgi:uncharacterized membrane protein